MSQTTGAHQAMDLGPWLLLPLLPLALLARIGTLWLVLVGALLLTPPPAGQPCANGPAARCP